MCLSDRGYAASENGQGVVGVAPNVKVMGLEFLQGRDGGTVANGIKVLQYATSMGVRISNNSYGDTPFSQAQKDAIEASGQLFIASAGKHPLSSGDQRPGQIP